MAEHHDQARDAAIGGLAGGLLANSVGKGHGRVPVTAVGAIVGAVVGGQLHVRTFGSSMSESTSTGSSKSLKATTVARR